MSCYNDLPLSAPFNFLQPSSLLPSHNPANVIIFTLTLNRFERDLWIDQAYKRAFLVTWKYELFIEVFSWNSNNMVSI